MQTSINARVAIALLPLILLGTLAKANPKYEKTVVGDFCPQTAHSNQPRQYSWGQLSWTEEALRRMSTNWHPKSFNSRIWLFLILNKSGQANTVQIAASSGQFTLDEEAATAAKLTIFPLESTDLERISRTPQDENVVIFKSLILDSEAASFCNSIFAERNKQGPDQPSSSSVLE